MTEQITFESLCEGIPDDRRAWLDTEKPILESIRREMDDCDSDMWRYYFQKWRQDGYLILKNFIPHDLIDAYCERYERDNGKDAPFDLALMACAPGQHTKCAGNAPKILNRSLLRRQSPTRHARAGLVGERRKQRQIFSFLRYAKRIRQD